jgi:hypothetical protein
MPKRKTDDTVISKAREDAVSDFKRELTLERFREANPQLWLQSQRIGRVLEIQSSMPNQCFPEGSCFLHANLVTVSSFCVKRIQEVNLDTCQVTVEIHGDEDLEAGIIIIPLENVEWFGFPSTAVPIEIHFQGFTGLDTTGKVKVEEKKPKLVEEAKPEAAPLKVVDPAARVRK